MILARFDDLEYVKQPITHIRHTVRVFLKTQNNKYIFMKIKGADDFGERNHLESVGGGVEDNESLNEAILREVREETGYVVSNIKSIGTIIDRYYLIGRETHSHFFVGNVDTTNRKQTYWTDLEKFLFDEMVELSEDEVITALNNPQTKIGKLIYRRDLLAFMKMLDNN